MVTSENGINLLVQLLVRCYDFTEHIQPCLQIQNITPTRKFILDILHIWHYKWCYAIITVWREPFLSLIDFQCDHWQKWLTQWPLSGFLKTKPMKTRRRWMCHNKVHWEWICWWKPWNTIEVSGQIKWSLIEDLCSFFFLPVYVLYSVGLFVHYKCRVTNLHFVNF